MYEVGLKSVLTRGWVRETSSRTPRLIARMHIKKHMPDVVHSYPAECTQVPFNTSQQVKCHRNHNLVGLLSKCCGIGKPVYTIVIP